MWTRMKSTRCRFLCIIGLGTALVGFMMTLTITDRERRSFLWKLGLDLVDVLREGVNPTCVEQVQTVCQTLDESVRTPPDPKLLKNLLVFDKLKIIFCFIPKAGSTSFKAMLMYASDHRNASRQRSPRKKSWSFTKKLHATVNSNYKSLDSYSAEETQHRLDTYFKFMVVRHPLERLASTYHDKFHERRSSTITFNKFNRKIHKTMNHSSSHLKQPISFKDFVQYLTVTEPEHYDEHWTRYQDICFPCDINYNYIAKLETLSEDVPIILERVKKAELSLPSYNANGDDATEEIYRAYYKEVDEATLNKLYSIYELDFKLFNYDKNLWHS